MLQSGVGVFYKMSYLRFCILISIDVHWLQRQTHC